MTQIQVIDQRLEIEILGWHKLWSFKSRFDLPLAHVTECKRLEKPAWPGGLRLPGTAFPGVICAGSYYQNGKWFFWDVCRMDKVVVIGLKQERYSALYLETVDPDATLAMFRARLVR